MAKINHEYFNYRPGETDKEYYIRLAKVTDQRLVRIEELSGLRGKEPVPGYAEAYQWGYRKVMEALPEGQMRFNATIPTAGSFEFRERTAAMRTFLSSPSSTKSGIQKTFINKAATFNKTYGTNFTGEELGKFFDRGDWDRLFKQEKFGSDTIFKAVAKVQKAKANANKLQAIIDKEKQGVSKAKVNEELKQAMKKMGIKADPSDDVALEILRKSNLNMYKTMDKETRAIIRKAIRNL